MKIKVNDATLDKIFAIIEDRRKQCNRGENSSLFEMAQMHELAMLQLIIEKEFKYAK